MHKRRFIETGEETAPLPAAGVLSWSGSPFRPAPAGRSATLSWRPSSSGATYPSASRRREFNFDAPDARGLMRPWTRGGVLSVRLRKWFHLRQLTPPDFRLEDA